MNEMDFFTGKAGEPVPVVDAADIRAMWNYGRELNSQNGGRGVGVEVDVWKQVCQPGADIRAVSHRYMMLWFLERMLRAAWTGGELSENAFKVAARMDLNWMPVGVPSNGLPFNLEEFLVRTQVEAA
jgi:hypothetical protein